MEHTDLRNYRIFSSDDSAEIYCTKYREFALIQISLEIMSNSKLEYLTKFQHADGSILFMVTILKNHENLESFLRNKKIRYTTKKNTNGTTDMDSLIIEKKLETIIENNTSINFALISTLKNYCKKAPRKF